ncbi:phosphoenolpyruvate--protein phosphotransferase [Aliifodinibius sp. S!AR15-10]|uniref:phosphoenolpyruvate--protein phosphotransferase n=1 Tax=Aliifodinibius sp. S!AR15-10 TaxID=2950437 RepID=UPI002861E512|nr:phosphoenolpyruvate--protein phosphotransferase [Aliifodinibius sp. S!AR15-10]MDR8394060.1 phosphoenolpyruvate--protein phosphotransferase [Aliifodinibius sp. S!AR15-10]
MTTDVEQPASSDFVLQGVPASNGIAIGKGYIYRRPKPVVNEEKIDSSNITKHVELFDDARRVIEMELQRLKRKEIDEISLQVIDAQVEMVNDPDLEQQVKSLIEDRRHSVDYAIKQVFDSYLEMLSKSQNKITQERMIDLEDVRDRLIQVATNYSIELDIEPGSIVIAEDISPREVIQFSDYNISALVTDHGGQTSHASILARSMGIPSVVGTKRTCQLVEASSQLIVDGNEGLVIVDPDECQLEEYKEKIKNQQVEEQKLRRIISEPSETKDGVPFNLCANIEFVEELPNLQKYGAHGVGLLRTESLFIHKEHFEDQSMQTAFYSEILEKTGSDPVTIRLFDAGGDKFFSMNSDENNPFLGWRGVRMLLDERDLLREQLKAILTVAGRNPGRVKILVPMISIMDEVLEVKDEIASIQEELEEEGIPVDHEIQVGIMVEVPSVAIKAEAFAKEVDFFSVGTNDLTQYTLAVDRGNELISELYQEVHPSVMELIHDCVVAAKQEDIDIAVCGEIASYPKAAVCLMGMGITELSMSPVAIPKVKTLLKKYSTKQMEEIAEEVLSSITAAEVNSILSNL